MEQKYHSELEYTAGQVWIEVTKPDVKGLLQIKSSAPIKPSKPQVACDHGLFSDEADQLDLCEMFMDE